MTHESVVYCEGYLDRAFWKGWLTRLGCTNPFEDNPRVKDPWKKPVTGGQFGFWNPGGEFIRIVPCNGKANILPQVRLRLEQRDTKAIRRLVVNWDADTIDQPGGEEPAPKAQLRDIVGSFQVDAARTPEGDFVLEGEQPTTISLVVWEAEDEPAPGLPDKQTLERLCCAAILDAYADRGERVSRWIRDLGEAPDPSPKSFSWSYMAGWYPDRGCEAFFEALWQDDALAEALRTRLEATGGWRVAESLIA